jgi:hypothetical protein
MEKSDTSRTLRQLAAKMRQQAQETAMPDYQSMMNRVAETLEAEADLVAEHQLRGSSRALEIYRATQFTDTRLH